jgi:hypothetical protein
VCYVAHYEEIYCTVSFLGDFSFKKEIYIFKIEHLVEKLKFFFRVVLFQIQFGSVRIRILLKVSDPNGSGSTTLLAAIDQQNIATKIGALPSLSRINRLITICRQERLSYI